MRLSRRLSCLISAARASSVSRSPNSLMRSAAVLTPMPGTPGTLSDESPISACTSIDLGRRHAEALDHLRLADRLVLHGVVHDDAGLDELHQVLVGGDDGHVGAGVDRLERIGGDDVVGLVALLLDAGDVEGAHRVAHQRELGDEVVRAARAGWPCSRRTDRSGRSWRNSRRSPRYGWAAPVRRSRAAASTTWRRSRAPRRPAARPRAGSAAAARDRRGRCSPSRRSDRRGRRARPLSRRRGAWSLGIAMMSGI